MYALEAIGDHLVDVTVANKCYPDAAAAQRDFEIFRDIWLDGISLRALRTLYLSYSHQHDITLEYLKAIELIGPHGQPMGFGDRDEVIYFKMLDTSGVLEAVRDGSQRPENIQWARAAIDRLHYDQDAQDLLGSVWDGQVPFKPYDPEALVYHVGRKQGNRLSSRDRLDELGLSYKTAASQSLWLSSRGSANVKPTYFALLKQTAASIKRRRLEQVSLPQLIT